MSKYISEHIKNVSVSINDINFEIPEIQRIRSDESVKNIYEFQNNYYKSNNYYLILGTITVVSFRPSGIEYLIDGQHRISAFKMLQKDYPERKIVLAVDYLYVENTDINLATQIIDELYYLVNKCTLNKVTILGICRYKIIEGLKKFFITEFSDYVKTSANPRKPHINLDKMCDYIVNNNVIDKLNIRNSTELINKIIELNRYYSKLLPEQFVKFGVKDSHSLYSKMNKYSNRLYLGFYNKFEWIERIVESIIHKKEYQQLNHISYDYRPKITVDLRKKVWDNKNLEGICFCCKELLEYDSFECGHVIPVSLGGLTNKENLKPICRKCNQDMRNMNMMDYINLLDDSDNF